MTVSTLAAGYIGRRTVVVAEGDVESAHAIASPLVDAGVEVHVIAPEGTARWPGVASWNDCDLSSDDAIDVAVARVGAVVQHVFHCRPSLGAFRAVALAVKPLMLTGGSIVGAGSVEAAVDEFVVEHGAAFAEVGIRLLAASVGEALSAGAPGLA